MIDATRSQPRPGPVQHGQATIIFDDRCLTVADAWLFLLQLAAAIREAQSAAVTLEDVLARVDRAAAREVAEMEAGEKQHENG